MLRADYLERLIREVFTALREALRLELPVEERLSQVRALYQTFGRDASFFREAAEADIVSQVARYSAQANHQEPDEVEPQQLLDSLELLAELYYAEWQLTNNDPQAQGLANDLAQRASALLKRVDENSSTFSLERKQHLEALQNAV